jgi:hypothetical protein
MEDPALRDYEELLHALLRPSAPLTDNESLALRTAVRERRSGRTRRTEAAPAIQEPADAIVTLLERAARHLRPRETQQLDDLVAGKAPAVDPAPRHPVRLHRNGWRSP